MANNCPRCGFENPEDTFYCGKCAAPLPSSGESGPSQTETLQTPLKELATGITFAGHLDKAQEYYQEIGSQGVNRAYIYWKTGKKDEAKILFQKNLDRLQKRIDEGDEATNRRFYMAAIHAVLEDKDEALRWLEKAVDFGWNEYLIASRYPLLENIREDERFKKIMDEAKAKVAEMRRRVEQIERDSSK